MGLTLRLILHYRQSGGEKGGTMEDEIIAEAGGKQNKCHSDGEIYSYPTLSNALVHVQYENNL